MQKTSLEVPLDLTKQLPSLNLRQSGCEFFTQFQTYCTEDEWEYFISKKVLPLHDVFTTGFLQLLRDKSNVYWAECYEEAKISLHKRNREIGKANFNSTLFIANLSNRDSKMSPIAITM